MSITSNKSNPKKVLVVVFLSLLLVFTSLLVSARIPVMAQNSNYEIQWFSVDGGGSMSSSGGGYTVSGTIGQPDAGALSGGNFALQGGFWNKDTANNLLEILLPVVVK